MRSLTAVVVAFALLGSTSAWARDRLIHPVSNGERAKWVAKQEAGITDWQQKKAATATRLGVRRDGAAVMKVTAPSLSEPAFVVLRDVKTSYEGYQYTQMEGRKISAAEVDPKGLTQPSHPNRGRQATLAAAGLTSAQADHARVTQIGVKKDGTSILMVGSRKKGAVKVPSIVASKDGDAKKLTAAEMKKLGLISPQAALAQAAKNGGLFEGVKGKKAMAGMSRWRGQAYLIEVTPPAPVKVKTEYGTYTVKKLRRVINVSGNGETAQPIGKSTFDYQPEG